MIRELYTAIVVAALTLTAGVAHAGPLKDRIAAGKSIRLGFANAAPWAYPGDNGEPVGFVNAITIHVLGQMGYTNVEPVLTDFGGLIPSMIAGRVDIITGGMYILNERCKNVDFSDPIGQFGAAFIVPHGNPNGLNTYADIKSSGATVAIAGGYSMIADAKREGVTADKIIEVPGITEVLAAVKSGRADVGAMTAVEANKIAAQTDGIDATDTNKLPQWTFNWVGVGFNPQDKEFLAAFNKAMKDYIGTPAMLKDVTKYDYSKSNIPGDVATKWICANR